MSTATVRTGASADRLPGEVRRHRLAEETEERRRDVVDRHVGERATEGRRGARGGEHEDAVPVVVRFIRSGVVLEGVDAAHADRADRAPVEVAEVDDEVRRDAVHAPVEVLGPVRLRADVAPVRRGDRLDARDEIAPYALVVGRVDRAGWLAA